MGSEGVWVRLYIPRTRRVDVKTACRHVREGCRTGAGEGEVGLYSAQNIAVGFFGGGCWNGGTGQFFPHGL